MLTVVSVTRAAKQTRDLPDRYKSLSPEQVCSETRICSTTPTTITEK